MILAPLALIVASAVARQPPAIDPHLDAAPPLTDETQASPTLDELIDHLPTVGAEGHYDDATKKWVYVPRVEELRRRIDAGTQLTQDQWQRALTRAGVIQTHAKWPAGSTIIVSMQDAAWLPMVEIRLVPRDHRLNSLHGGKLLPEFCGNAAELDRRTQAHQQFGQLPVGKHHIVFDAEIERGTAWRGRADGEPNPDPGIVWKGAISLDLEVVATLQDAMPPVHDAATTNAIRTAFGCDAKPWGLLDALEAVAVFDADVSKTPRLATTAISAKAGLFHDGELVEEFPFAVTGVDSYLSINSIYPGPTRMFTFCRLSQVPASALSDPKELSRWSLRVEGTSNRVIDFTRADRYWDGVFEISLADAMKVERERMNGKTPRSYIWMP